MPKLLAYLPCEKVVVEEESKNISVTLWQKEKGESGEFESKSVLASPEGTAYGNNRMTGFPISAPGSCQLKLMVRTSCDAAFRELANVIIVVRHSTG